MKYYFLLFCLIANVLAQETSEENKGTSKCTPTQLSEVVNDHDACYVEAENFLLEGIADGNFLKGLCDTIGAKIRCIDKHAPRCLNEDGVAQFHLNFLQKQVEKAKNDSDLLGDTFINSCPHLRNFQQQYVLETFGSNRCTFDQITSTRAEKKLCEEKAANRRDAKFKLADFVSNPRALFENTLCDFKKELDRCTVDLYNCMSPQERKEIDEVNRQSFAEYEESLQSRGLTGFTFSGTCRPKPTTNSRSLGKRSIQAIMDLEF